MGAELFHAVGQTDAPKLIVAFLDFTNEPKRNNFRAFAHFRLLSRKTGGLPETVYCVCTVGVHFSAFFFHRHTIYTGE